MADDAVLRVTYVDADDDDRPLEQRSLRRRDLPPGLLFPPRIQLDGGDWAIVDCQPREADEALRLGRLRLRIRRVSDLDGAAVTFERPSLAGALPPLEKGRRRVGAVLELSEDAWRQVELVGVETLGPVERCLSAVRGVIDQRTAAGYPALHLRRDLPRPVPPEAVSLADVRGRFQGAFGYDGLSYRGVQALIEGGFAFQVASSIQVYGRIVKGSVACLGLHGWGSGGNQEADTRALTDLATDRRLLLVDWCRGVLLTPEAFADYFRQRSRA